MPGSLPPPFVLGQNILHKHHIDFFVAGLWVWPCAGISLCLLILAGFLIASIRWQHEHPAFRKQPQPVPGN